MREPSPMARTGSGRDRTGIPSSGRTLPVCRYKNLKKLPQAPVLFYLSRGIGARGLALGYGS